MHIIVLSKTIFLVNTTNSEDSTQIDGDIFKINTAIVNDGVPSYAYVSEQEWTEALTANTVQTFNDRPDLKQHFIEVQADAAVGFADPDIFVLVYGGHK